MDLYCGLIGLAEATIFRPRVVYLVGAFNPAGAVPSSFDRLRYGDGDRGQRERAEQEVAWQSWPTTSPLGR